MNDDASISLGARPGLAWTLDSSSSSSPYPTMEKEAQAKGSLAAADHPIPKSQTANHHWPLLPALPLPPSLPHTTFLLG